VNRQGWLAALAVALLGAACVVGTPTQPPAKTLRIGVDLPLTGGEARAAAPALYGIRFFVKSHPMLDGFNVALRTADDAAGGQPDPSLGAANVRAFLTDPILVAMLGPYDAAVARAEIPIANAASLAMISPATSNPCLTRDVFTPARLNPARTQIMCKDAGLTGATQLRPAKGNNFFRLTTTDDLQGAAAADFAIAKLHALRAAVISDHETYGQGLVYSFSSRFTNRGGTIVGRLDIDPKNRDAAGFLKNAKDAGAQVVYYGGATAGGGCAIRAEMRNTFAGGEATPFLGGDGIAQDPACIYLAGENSPGIYATVPIVDADSQPGASRTIHDFRASYGSSSDYGPYTIVAYDATAILYAAIDQAIRAAGGGVPDRAAVTAAVAATAGLAGATGPLGFDKAGDTTNRVVSIFEATRADPRAPWKLVGSVDYSAKLPY
jgi:branched-chain amino acid transport system substrate-binding protein